MIKPVSVMNSIVKTPAVRNFATATMLTLGVLGVGACAGGSANKTTEQAQTEIVSAEGAEALKNYAKITPKTVSYEPNKKILEGFEKGYSWLHEMHKEQDIAKFNNTTKKYGTFVGTSVGQADISHYIFIGIIRDNSMFDRLETPKFHNAIDLVDAEIIRLMDFKNYLSAEEVSAKLDNYVVELPTHFANITETDCEKYFKSVNKFQQKQSKRLKNTEQGWADLIAFKTNKIVSLMYQNYIKNEGLEVDKKIYNKAEAEAISYSIGY